MLRLRLVWTFSEHDQRVKENKLAGPVASWALDKSKRYQPLPRNHGAHFQKPVKSLLSRGNFLVQIFRQ